MLKYKYAPLFEAIGLYSTKLKCSVFTGNDTEKCKFYILLLKIVYVFYNVK